MQCNQSLLQKPLVQHILESIHLLPADSNNAESNMGGVSRDSVTRRQEAFIQSVGKDISRGCVEM